MAGDCGVSGVKKVNLVANNGSGARGVSGLVDRHGVARRWCLVGVKEGMLGCRRRSLSSWKRRGNRLDLSRNVVDASDDGGRQVRWTGCAESVSLVRGFESECECAGHRRDLSECLIQRVTRRARGQAKIDGACQRKRADEAALGERREGGPLNDESSALPGFRRTFSASRLRARAALPFPAVALDMQELVL